MYANTWMEEEALALKDRGGMPRTEARNGIVETINFQFSKIQLRIVHSTFNYPYLLHFV